MTKNTTSVPVTSSETETPATSTETLDSLIPAADVIETTEGAVIHVDLPGVRQDDVDVEIENRKLSVSAISMRTNPDGQDLLREFSSAKYFRSFRLGEGLDLSRADASFENGVLEIQIPRIEAEAPKKIEIRSGDR